MRTLLLTSAAIAALNPANALAAEVGELIVTATRLESRIDLVTGARVIDRAELEARGVAFAADVLATVPGVGVTRNGAFGGIGAIRIRGAGADKTLVLVDGVPVGDPADPGGTFDPASLQLADLERIEVLSGPQGSLWGSEAIGGVVAFTTRELSGWRAQAEAGSFATARGFVAAGVARETHAVGASLAAFRTDGVSKADLGTEDDGFETVTANLGGRLRLSPALQIDGRARYTQSDIEIDGFAPPSFQLGDTADRNKSRAWSGFGRATLDGGLGFTHRISFSAYDIVRENLSAFPSRFEADRQVLRWTAEREGLVVGAERQATDADLAGRPSLDLSTTSVFAVGRRTFQALTVTASLRHDDPDRFGSRTTGRLSAAAALPAGFTLTAAAGQGFKVPTISQIICDFCFPAGPALTLRPERAEGVDLRLGWTSPRVTAAVTGYRLSVRDQIAYTAGRYVNIARTRSTGLEAEAEVLLAPSLTLKLAYARLDAINAASNASLIRVPDHSAAASLFWSQGPWSGALTARAESSQTDTARDGFSRVRRQGFATADLAAAYAVNPRVSLTARIENLSDARYHETFGYGEPGRAVYLGVRLRN
ncbi:TonB-dependent receptor plug domain-containing protein [Phenylobacterium sp.]|uniref:TonB-dependent receptor plug domain-containing protein n=1 Tax=Phenylobacterium sp. TaxID=1871053 RepID=UPI003983448A